MSNEGEGPMTHAEFQQLAMDESAIDLGDVKLISKARKQIEGEE